MKQIDNTQKKAYAEPKMKVIEIESASILAGSNDPEPEPKAYDDELGSKRRSIWDNDDF